MRRRNKGKIIINILVIALILGVFGFIGLKTAYTNATKAFNPEDTSQVVLTIPMGSGVSQIGGILEENNIINSKDSFKWVSKITGKEDTFKAGTYAFSPSMDMAQIMETLASGISVGNLVTIPEGHTISEVTALLETRGLIDQELFLDEVENGIFTQPFIDALPAGPNRLEGFLFPETYDIPVDADEHDIIQIMLNQFDKVFSEEYYSKATEMGYNLHEVITIAAMIEREAGADSDRPLVASVIYNRMAISMPLQLDATVQYALGTQKSRLMESDTKIESDYNTYLHVGLPPGPICSPGAESIRAALYPAETDFMYYVMDPNGNKTHKFAETYEEFLIYKKEYIDSL